jgi:CDP-glucose 4,6-dehydratase
MPHGGYGMNRAQVLSNTYKGKRILVTGHTGFKGSWLCKWLQMLGAEVSGYSHQILPGPNHFTLLDLDMTSMFGDIRNLLFLSKWVKEFKPDLIFHLAAQPIVRRSYNYPVETMSTNIDGTINVLEASRSSTTKGVVVVTSDKCYHNKEWVWPYREDDPMGGNDPYSASKGCAELVSSSYYESFLKAEHVQVATVRAGNVIGGGDWGEDRLIPDMIDAYTSGSTMIIRNPNSVRPWQYILDVLYGYLLVGAHILSGKDVSSAWNFGPSDTYSLSVDEVAKLVSTILRGPVMQYLGKLGPKESVTLRLDSSKSRALLGWEPRFEVQDSIWETIDWYRDYHESQIISTERCIEDYYDQLEHSEEL